MSTATQWRLELAHQITDYYRNRPGVKMIVLGGSVSSGTPDAYSDIDIVVFWQKIDTNWLAQGPLESVGGRRFTYRPAVPDQAFTEQYFIGAAKVDVGHIVLSWWDEVVTDVLDNANTEPSYQEMLNGFLAAVVLHGDVEYERWRKRIAAYPDTLAHKMVEQHLFFYPQWAYKEQALDRSEIFYFYSIVGSMVKNALGVLAGLNRVYFSTEKLKHIDDVLSRMSIRPPDAAARLNAIIAGNRQQAPELLNALLHDVIALVEQHMPDIDTARARHLISIELAPCSEKPVFPTAG